MWLSIIKNLIDTLLSFFAEKNLMECIKGINTLEIDYLVNKHGGFANEEENIEKKMCQQP